MADLTTAKILLLFVVFLHEFYSGFSHPNADSDETITWAEYKKKYGKVYNGEDDKKHEIIFNENLEIIKKHNIVYGEGKSTWKAGVNKFTDMNFFAEVSRHEHVDTDFEELDMDKLEIEPDDMKRKRRLIESKNLKFKVGGKDENVPNSVDWTKRGAVTPVLDGHHCHIDYAAAFLSAMSSNAYISNAVKSLRPFSTQEIVDCSERSDGCNGGTVMHTIRYISKNGVHLDKNYPFTDTVGKCRNPTGPRYKFSAISQQHKGDEYSLMLEVAKGPLAVTLSLNLTTFIAYHGGIYHDPNYDQFSRKISLTLTGYGSECVNGTPIQYWILKNNWGTKWGENGYVKIPRNNNNMYEITNFAVRPVFS